MQLNVRTLTRAVVLVALGGLLLTLVADWSGDVAIRSGGARLVLETAVSMVGALVALVVYGRFRRSRSLGELLLVNAMLLLSLSALLLVTLPELLAEPAQEGAAAWGALVVRLVAGICFATAAVLPPRVLWRLAHPGWELVAVVVSVSAVAGLTQALASRLPDAVRAQAPGVSGGALPALDAHPVVVTVQLLQLVCYVVAAVGLTRRAGRDRDAMLGWFAAACALGACSRLAYLMQPSLYTDWLTTGDLLRVGFYLFVLVGAVLELRAYWETQTAAAVAAERRRLARDLHDGVVQELGYIRTETARLSASPQLVSAAERALSEALSVLSTLRAAEPEPLATAIERAVREVCERHQVPVRVDVDDVVNLPPAHREQLVRVAREATMNAVRHSGADSLDVTLRDGALTVVDAGRGFDPTAGRPGGFGLRGMRERCQSIDAVLRVESAPGRGTTVAVTW